MATQAQPRFPGQSSAGSAYLNKSIEWNPPLTLSEAVFYTIF
jgi:hypothetical protein